MTAEPDNDPSRAPFAAHEPARRNGSIVLVLLVAFAIVAVAVALMTIGRAQAQPYILGLLALLAMVGLFNLFAFAAGIIRFADRAADDPVMSRIADHAYDGLAVTDSRGHVVYSNAAYLALTGAATAQDARPVERVFIGNPDVSEAVFRLLKAAREGKRQQEEVRIAGSDGSHGRWLRMRVRPLGASKREAKYAVWSIADITRDRERQEDVFQELQHAIEYLDHAPCGFFSVNAGGDLVYVNATLANWLDHDLAEIGNGGLKLTDIVSGDGASLLTSIVAVPGEVKTEVFDIDLRMRGGKTMPVRLYHKLAFGADGVPGASRTLVISRARDEHSDPQRAAEVRFMRFFDHTPMAIATVDRVGAVVRANARYAKLAQGLNSDGASGKSIFRAVNPRDRHLLIAAINQAAEGQGDIAPVEAMLDGPKERWGQFFVTAVEENERETEAAIVYLLETTERRTLENQINQSQKMDMVGQLAGGIAHDFNNVLSAIMMANDFLLNAHKPTDPSFQDIMQIKQNATRAATLVRQLLAFSRRQTLRPQVLDLGDALVRSHHAAAPPDRREGKTRPRAWPRPVAGQGRRLPVRAGDRQPRRQRPRCDARRRQADGADRQCDDGRIRAARLQGHAGGGLCPDRRRRHRHRHSRRHRRQDLRAVLLDQGSRQGHRPRPVDGVRHRQADRRFCLCGLRGRQGHLVPHLPAAAHCREGGRPRSPRPPTARPRRAPAEAKPRTDLTGQGTILLVEDEEGLRSLNARGLRSRGYSVIEASNGIEAMEALEEKNGAVDLVVSDVVMPEMDGPTLLREMRIRNPNLKIIFVSGYAEEAFDKSLPENEQFAFLAKPFALSALVAKVKETMAPS